MQVHSRTNNSEGSGKKPETGLRKCHREMGLTAPSFFDVFDDFSHAKGSAKKNLVPTILTLNPFFS